MLRQFVVFVVVALFSFTASAEDSDEYSRFNDKFRIYVGGFAPEISSKAAINGEDVSPPPVDFEETLGLEESDTTAFIGMAWHISNRNSLEFEYFKLNRNGAINLLDGEDEPIPIGDYVITAGSVNTAFDVGIGRLTYGFSVIRSERADLQLKAGLHLADMSLALQLTGDICDLANGDVPPACPSLQTQKVDQDVTAPLPHLGGSFGYAITPNIDLNINLIGFALELDSLDGSLIEFDADVQWSPWRNFGIGAGLRYFNANVKSKGSDLNGEFDFEYWGPAVFVSTSF